MVQYISNLSQSLNNVMLVQDSILIKLSVYIFFLLIIKITISSIVIGLKKTYFPLIHLLSCYRTVQQTNHIQSCSLNQPITFKVVV